jgi:glutathione synthase/RimK-type ligase-like ATP-grasp enzyme
MVLICGDPSEEVIAFFSSYLEAIGIARRILDLRGAPSRYSIKLSRRKGPPSGSIAYSNWTLGLDEISGVYFRNVSFADSVAEAELFKEGRAYPQTDPQTATLLDTLACRVVNRPATIYSNRSKPYQALIIRRFGFEIPKTLITNDPASARHFYSECEGAVIFKSIGGVSSIVQRLSQEDFGRLALLKHGPAQFQEYVPGDNLRVHVVGERLFSVRIQSDAVDYRYGGQEGYGRKMIPAKLPEQVENNCIRLTRALGLAMAGIDLKETPQGEYYCFEVNTSPAFPFYESAARPVVSKALAEFLAQKSG